MRKIVYIFLLLINISYAQDNDIISFPKSQFSFGINTGWNQTNYFPHNNGQKINPLLNQNHFLRFAYRYRFNKKIFTEVAFNFGTQKERPNVPINGYENSTFGYFDHGFYFNFARFDLLGSYEVYKSNKFTINTLGGLGTNRFVHGFYGISYVSSNNIATFNYEPKDNFIGLGQIGTEISFVNKKQDEFSFRIMYNHGFSSFYEGNYTLSQDDFFSSGTFESKLRGINIGFNYTFTRIAKTKRISNDMSAGLSKKEARKKSKFEKRAIDPKSQFLFLGIGLADNSTRVTPKNTPFKNGFFPSFIPRISYEIGFKNNIFFEVDYFSFLFTHANTVRFDNTSSFGFASSVFYGHFLNIGTQYKIQNQKTNFQFINIHAGLGLGFHPLKKGPDGYGGGGGSSEGFSFNYSYDSEIRSNFMPVIYAGLSKDIRITEKLGINFTYRHQLGFVNAYNSDYVYSDSNNQTPKTLTSKIDGTAFFLQMGLKYRIK
jgi:hypothetical protein